MKKVMVFIDGNNFENAVFELYDKIVKLDYYGLANLIAGNVGGDLSRFYFYTAQGSSKKDSVKYNNTQKFINHLNQKAKRCVVRVGELKYLGQDANGEDIITEKRTDVNVAIDMLSLAFNNAYDTAVLLSADTDYIPVIEKVRELGKVVIVCLVDQQKGGMIKAACDDNIVLTKKDLDVVKR